MFSPREIFRACPPCCLPRMARQGYTRRRLHRTYIWPGMVAGLNFWAWAGEGRPRDPSAERVMWAPNDTWTGDPPHEPQGWYSVYAEDTASHEVFAQCARSLQGQRRARCCNS